MLSLASAGAVDSPGSAIVLGPYGCLTAMQHVQQISNHVVHMRRAHCTCERQRLCAHSKTAGRCSPEIPRTTPVLKHLGVFEASLIRQLCAPDGFLGQRHSGVCLVTPVIHVINLHKQHLRLQLQPQQCNTATIGVDVHAMYQTSSLWLMES